MLCILCPGQLEAYLHSGNLFIVTLVLFALLAAAAALFIGKVTYILHTIIESFGFKACTFTQLKYFPQHTIPCCLIFRLNLLSTQPLLIQVCTSYFASI